jgi:hypothetical protein
MWAMMCPALEAVALSCTDPKKLDRVAEALKKESM